MNALDDIIKSFIAFALPLPAEEHSASRPLRLPTIELLSAQLADLLHPLPLQKRARTRSCCRRSSCCWTRPRRRRARSTPRSSATSSPSRPSRPRPSETRRRRSRPTPGRRSRRRSGSPSSASRRPARPRCARRRPQSRSRASPERAALHSPAGAVPTSPPPRSKRTKSHDPLLLGPRVRSVRRPRLASAGQARCGAGRNASSSDGGGARVAFFLPLPRRLVQRTFTHPDPPLPNAPRPFPPFLLSLSSARHHGRRPAPPAPVAVALVGPGHPPPVRAPARPARVGAGLPDLGPRHRPGRGRGADGNPARGRHLLQERGAQNVGRGASPASFTGRASELDGRRWSTSSLVEELPQRVGSRSPLESTQGSTLTVVLLHDRRRPRWCRRSRTGS